MELVRKCRECKNDYILNKDNFYVAYTRKCDGIKNFHLDCKKCYTKKVGLKKKKYKKYNKEYSKVKHIYDKENITDRYVCKLIRNKTRGIKESRIMEEKELIDIVRANYKLKKLLCK